MKAIQHITGFVSMVLCILGFGSCLDSNSAETITTDYYNAIITSFKLEANSDVCKDLSNYSFTIDNYGYSDDSIHRLYPNDGIIFNPDSLPVGAIPDSVKISLGYASPYTIELKMYNKLGELGRSLTYASDSALYFGSYPDCRLIVTAYGGNTKTYHVKINVHKVEGDTIVWHDYTDELWADRTIDDQRVDTLNEMLCWYIQEGNQISVSTSDLKAKTGEWQPMTNVGLPGDELFDLSSLYNFKDALYVVSQNNGKLLCSDDAYNWEVANEELQFVSILGTQPKTKNVYGEWNSDSLNAIVKVGDEYHYAVSADARNWNVEQTVKENFPIKGFTRPISISARNKYGNLTSRIYIVGGVTAKGELVSSTWSCDGWLDEDKGPNWEDFEQNELPAMTGASVIEYTLDSDNPRTFWILQPGIQADGSVPTNRLFGKTYTTLFYSEDNGVSWHRLSRYYTQYADNSALGALACNSAFFNQKTYQMYFFGGRRADGTFKTAVWGGVLNSLTFDKKR